MARVSPSHRAIDQPIQVSVGLFSLLFILIVRLALANSDAIRIVSRPWTILIGYGMDIMRGTPGRKNLISGSRDSQFSAFSFFFASAAGRGRMSFPFTKPHPAGMRSAAPSPVHGARKP